MSARDITFARKTTTIDGFLTRYWYWGERERLNSIDPQEQQYQMCYPGQPPIHVSGRHDRRRPRHRRRDDRPAQRED